MNRSDRHTDLSLPSAYNCHEFQCCQVFNHYASVEVSMEMGTWMGTRISMYGEWNLERATTFKYLRVTFAENGHLDADMMYRIQ